MADNRTPRNLFEALFGREAYNKLVERFAIPEEVKNVANRAYSGLTYLFASPTPEEIERTAYGLTAPLRTAFQPPSERVYQVAEIASKPFEALAKGLSPAMEKVAKTLASAFQGETKIAIPEEVKDVANRIYSGLAYLFASPTPEEVEKTAYGLTAPLRTAFQPPSEKVYQVAEIASKPFKALAEGLSPAMEKVAKTLASAFQRETETAIPTAKAEEVPASAPTLAETPPTPSPAPAKTPADLIDWEALSRLFRDKRATPAGIKLVLSTILDAFRLLGAVQRRSPFETLIEAYEPLLTLQKSYLSALQQETNPKAKEQLLLKINEIERRLQPFYAFVNMISRAYGLPTAGIPVGEETPTPTGATAPTTASALPLVPPEKIEESPFAKHLSKYLGRE